MSVAPTHHHSSADGPDAPAHAHTRECYLPPVAVPYGSNLIDDIPIPPFADIVDYEVFSMWLMQHLAMIDDAMPSPSTIMLNAALSAFATSDDTTDIVLSTPELIVTLSSGLPMRWTLESLAAAFTAAGRPHRVDERGRWHTDGDVTLVARPFRFETGWLVTAVEDGRTTRFRVGDDIDLMRTLMYNFLRHHEAHRPFPIGFSVSLRDLVALVPTAMAVRARHGIEVTHPLHVGWAHQHSLAWLLDPDMIDPKRDADLRAARDAKRRNRRAELSAAKPETAAAE